MEYINLEDGSKHLLDLNIISLAMKNFTASVNDSINKINEIDNTLMNLSTR